MSNILNDIPNKTKSRTVFGIKIESKKKNPKPDVSFFTGRSS